MASRGSLLQGLWRRSGSGLSSRSGGIILAECRAGSPGGEKPHVQSGLAHPPGWREEEVPAGWLNIGVLQNRIQVYIHFQDERMLRKFLILMSHFKLNLGTPGLCLSFLLLNSGPPEGDYEKRRTSLLSHIHLFLDLLNCFKVGSFLPSLRFNMRRP